MFNERAYHSARYSGKSQGLYKQEKTAVNLMEHMGQWGCINVNYKLSMWQHQLVELCIRGLGQKTMEIFTRWGKIELHLERRIGISERELVLESGDAS